MLGILAVGQVIQTWAGSCGYALMMTGHQRPYAWLLAVSTVITVTLDVLLYDVWGIEGIALATTVMLALQNIVQVVYLKRVAGFTTTADLRPHLRRSSLVPRGAARHAPERSGRPVPLSAQQREEPFVVRSGVRRQPVGDRRRWRGRPDVAVGSRLFCSSPLVEPEELEHLRMGVARGEVRGLDDEQVSRGYCAHQRSSCSA